MPSHSQIFAKLPPLGYADAIDRVGFTASPLLAGFAVTFSGFVLTGNVAMRWPNVTLVGLVAAALLLIASLQLAFNARSSYLPYSEFSQRLDLVDEANKEGVREDYVIGLDAYRKLATWAGRSYNLGISILLFAFAAALVPAGSLDDVDALRWVASGAAAIGGLIEMVWAGHGELAR
jgi:hypothetical protein